MLVLMFGLFLFINLAQAQTPTVANLQATGTNIKWYLTQTGGAPLSTSTPLINGQHYWASQTLNGCESTSRFEVVATINIQAAPTTAAHTPSQTQVIWNWNTATGATGYKWNTVNVYASATDMTGATTKTETGLTCNTAYTRYVWAYNASGCVSAATTLSQTTASCVAAPAVVTSAATTIGSTSATLNGNITSVNGATVTGRGFKYSMTNGFDPVTSGTNVSESGSYSAGTYSLTAPGLTPNSAYYYVAWATNSAGTSYGSQQSFTTQIQTDFSYTGGIQTFIVPAGITTVTIEAWGAEGGVDASPANGGYGGYAKGTLAVSPGATLYLFVGGQGQSGSDYDRNNAGGWNGGGNGGYDNSSQTRNGGGGGGASDVRYGGQALGNRVIVAGGGGGSANSVTGGNGGGASGNAGSDGSTAGGGGGGGTQGSGGTVITTSRGATYGSFGQGGNGSTNQDAWGSAGGGGGYYGGAGGTSTSDHGSGYAAGGGGGSSYLGGVTGGTTTSGLRSGNGQVKISY